VQFFFDSYKHFRRFCTDYLAALFLDQKSALAISAWRENVGVCESMTFLKLFGANLKLLSFGRYYDVLVLHRIIFSSINFWGYYSKEQADLKSKTMTAMNSLFENSANIEWIESQSLSSNYSPRKETPFCKYLV
jgi:hypothetical protein